MWNKRFSEFCNTVSVYGTRSKANPAKLEFLFSIWLLLWPVILVKVWYKKNRSNACSILPFLSSEHYCNYFHTQEKIFLAEEQQCWADIERTSGRKPGTFKTKSFGKSWVIHHQFRELRNCHRLLISAKTGRRRWVQPGHCGCQHLNCHTHLTPSRSPGSWSSRRGGRRVDFPSCRPVLLQETKMNDNKVRL